MLSFTETQDNLITAAVCVIAAVQLLVFLLGLRRR